MQKYNIHTAKTHLSALVEKAAEGEALLTSDRTVSQYSPTIFIER
jgi:antitoxin (DNA-binding transcriptional repressor) of toxin-antitoxin stability system